MTPGSASVANAGHRKSGGRWVSLLLAAPGIACLMAGLTLGCFPETAAAAEAVERAAGATGSPVIDYFADWFTRADKSRAEQPHWAPPVATTYPALQEVFRYDVSRQSLANGHKLTSFGSGKGLEFIPAENVQFIVALPAWQTQNTTPRKEGWADETFLMKYRLWSGNEENGNYVVTAFLGLSVPNGSDNYTTHHFVFTPTAAVGKGWGDFDIQSTFGVSVPDNEAGRRTLGTPLALNATAQYRFAKVLWPEVEVNYTYWPNGTHEGLNQAFITPGLVLGKFPLWGRVGVTIGAGCQFALTDHPLYRRNIILTGRIPF